MKAIALDDEPLAIQIIESFCKKVPLIESIQGFTNSSMAASHLRAEAVDLMFLDINMPSVNGLDFFRSLTVKPLLILTTSYSEFALDGYELSAIDYLLKPFSFDRFLKAVEKAQKQSELLKLNSALGGLLTIKADLGLVQVPIQDILYIEGLDNYIKIHLEDGNFVLSRNTLKAILNDLPTQQFFRIHKSYIVSKSKINYIGTKYVKIGTIELPFGKSYEADLKGFLK
ncbi:MULTISPECIES: LytR/AlgR family response regulator transcription factor [unclassified Paraflavitalea]|uniref:LytR/AlgR family response regulator transcription factor n=1 Tax=unclassified Paraflavitalea TaxID=2798305 RepID=UPI003D343618